jgi:hypothetical protein
MAKKEIKPATELIIETLREKSGMKQDVVEKTDIAFKSFKQQANEIAKQLQKDVTTFDKRLKIEHSDKSSLIFHLRFAGDTLIFYRHTNIFQFEKSHPLWKTAYFRDDEQRSYCGIINIFNFLTDSLLYQRQGDRGYLVARVFINKDGHYFVEGKRQLSFLYNNFTEQVFDDSAAHSIIESAMLYSLDFDLYTPPYDSIKEVGVSDILEQTANLNISTAKRLGFRFQSDDEAMM